MSNKMDNKQNHQIVLPFDLEKREIGALARQAWQLTFAKQKEVSVYAKRMMAVVIAQIRENDSELPQYHRLHVTDLAGPDGVSPNYTRIKTAFMELMGVTWQIEDLKTGKWVPRHLLDSSSDNFGYDNGNIYIALNPKLKDYFIELSSYNQYEIKHFMTFESWYAMRLFELLSAFKDTGYWYVDIDKFRYLFDCMDKYKGSSMTLIRGVLTASQKELSATNLAFKYKTVYSPKEPGRMGRPSIIGVEFTLLKVKPKTIPANWFSNPKIKAVVSDLQKWKVSERNILEYIEIIGLTESRKLINAWHLSKGTKNHIQNPAAYCNKVYSDVGKKIIEDKKL